MDRGPIQSTGEFKVFYILYKYKMVTAVSPTNGKKKKEDDKKKKLTKVLSTKLSIDDYNRFEKYTYYAYQAGIIEEPETSKLLRYIVTYPFNEYGM
ncbi:MAG TPA: hypothetical protein VFY68_03880 [Nitrososphaeraceae archaeon]|nr:hypothetical protein [Nitrososphaeraceae archaeon]